jgi:hypothetical protein
LVTKVRVMYENLPSWLKSIAIEDNKLSLRFKNGSQIKAVTSSSDSGRSEALSLLIVDECCDGNTVVKIRNTKTNEIENVCISELFNRLKT